MENRLRDFVRETGAVRNFRGTSTQCSQNRNALTWLMYRDNISKSELTWHVIRFSALSVKLIAWNGPLSTGDLLAVNGRILFVPEYQRHRTETRKIASLPGVQKRMESGAVKWRKGVDRETSIPTF